jgi:HrpA-like RNA helicase
VSQSSANQRKGRAGRVQDGVCIRLYSEEDFQSRPPFTQPEIQRANLAEVILRMKAFRLGEIETFPFVNPPSPASIAGGYALLQELGAIDEKRDLTQMGRDLARLPIDPTLGRMLLQSQAEHATRELLIIASGLSVQDPRERPLDQRDAADAAHRRNADPRSDFLSLLRLWDAVHDEWEKQRAALAAAEDALKKERIGRIVERIDACRDKFKESDYEMYLELSLIAGAVRHLRHRWMEVHTERAISECCASMAEAMDEHLKEVTK